MLVQEPVQAAIWHCLNHYSYSDATFLAERLLAEVNSDEALHLVATAYYRSGKPGSAYSILKGHGLRSPQLRYLMAKCCYDIGKLDECESMLAGTSVLKPKSVDELTAEYGHIACFALQLLGMVCRKTERPQMASEYLRRSLKLNPFLWHSFTSLCDQGEKPDPNRIFRHEFPENMTHCHGDTIYTATNTSNLNTPTTNIGNITTSTPLLNHHGNTPTVQPMTPPPQQPPTQHSTTNVQMQSMATLNTPVWITVTPVTGGDVDTVGNSNIINISGQPKRQRYIKRIKRGFLGMNTLSPLTPSFGVLPLQDESNNSSLGSSLVLLSPSSTEGSNNNKRTGPLVLNKPNAVVFGSTANNSNFHLHHHSSPTTGQANVRRSSRLFGNSNNNANNNSSSVKENNKGHHQRFVQPKSPAARKDKKARSTKNHHQTSSLIELNEKNNKNEENLPTDTIIAPPPAQDSKKGTNSTNQSLAQQAVTIQRQSVEGLMSLLRDMGSAYLHLSQYDCSKAIDYLTYLPAQHYHTGWVLAHLGKAHFEMNDYTQAVKAFSDAREKEPHRVELMEYYSTALWHLQREVPLSALAQELVESDKNTPQAWCTTGNCFSLQKEHESAIRFFSRAIQVDSNCAYAYTLLGHEHIATEELDRALSCYKSAIRVDPRHYNAWYGIGLVLFKQERFGQAENYFKKALSIHPHSSVLMCHVAVVEHSLQKSSSALSTLNRALASDPKNPLCKYHRASVLHSLDRHEDALSELLQLKEIVPKESNVYFLLGKVYKKLGQTHLALMNFSWAMDLDPKGANNQYKEAIDPTINRFPVDDEDDDPDNSKTQRGHDFGSEASSSLAPVESSQESLVLEESAEMPLPAPHVPPMESLSDDSL